MDGRQEVNPGGKYATDLLKDYQSKGWVGFRPEDACVLHLYAIMQGVTFDQARHIFDLGAYLPHVSLVQDPGMKFDDQHVPWSYWEPYFRNSSLSFGNPRAVDSQNHGSRPAVRI